MCVAPHHYYNNPSITYGVNFYCTSWIPSLLSFLFVGPEINGCTWPAGCAHFYVEAVVTNSQHRYNKAFHLSPVGIKRTTSVVSLRLPRGPLAYGTVTLLSSGTLIQKPSQISHSASELAPLLKFYRTSNYISPLFFIEKV
jgi:hypothetical protein